MKNFIKKIVLFTIVLAAMISSMSSFCFAANGKLYCNGSTSWPINNPEEILKFSLSPGGDLVEGGSFSYPSFMTMTPEKGNCWHADFSNAKPGDEGTITYTENGQSYSCKIWLNLSDPNPNSEYGNWDGVNFTPSASQIKERRPLYSRGTIYSEDLSTLEGTEIIPEIWVVPGYSNWAFRLYTSESNARAFNCIRRTSGFSFPSFIKMYLNRGGQWQYNSYNAKVGDEGIATFFENGILYEAKVIVKDPYAYEEVEKPSFDEYTVEELDIAEDVLGEDLQEIIDQHAKHTGQITELADAKQSVHLRLSTVQDEELEIKEDDSEKAKALKEQVQKDIENINNNLHEDETLSASFDVSVTAGVVNKRTNATVASGITITELKEAIELSFNCDDIKTCAAKVVRVHDGQFEELETASIDREAGTIGVLVNKFSTYGVVTRKNVNVTIGDSITAIAAGSVFTSQEKEPFFKKLTGFYKDAEMARPFDLQTPLWDDITLFPQYAIKPVVYIVPTAVLIITVAAIIINKQKKSKR